MSDVFQSSSFILLFSAPVKSHNNFLIRLKIFYLYFSFIQQHILTVSKQSKINKSYLIFLTRVGQVGRSSFLDVALLAQPIVA